MNQRMVGFAALLSSLVSGMAEGGTLRRVNAPFQYRFFGTDVAAWADGTKAGPVKDSYGRMADALRETLSGARSSVDLAAYGIQDQERLMGDLAGLILRGVDLRVVVDQERGEFGDWSEGNFNYPDTARIPEVVGEDAVIPDLNPDGSPRAGTIMHDKFAVVDGRRLWTGSANFSATCMGADYNANVALLVDSPELAGLYRAQFRQMFEDHLFSRYKHPRGRRETLDYSDGTEVDVFFSPEDDALSQAILPFIEGARRRLDLGLFYMTDQGVADALVRAVERGVAVRVIYDAVAAAHPSSKHQYLREHGVKVRVETWGGKMHMKGGVADGEAVLIGSMNWSDAGSDQNDENTLWIRGNRRLGGEVEAYLSRLWESLPQRSERQDARAEGPESTNSCADGLDNDFDGFADAADSACR